MLLLFCITLAQPQYITTIFYWYLQLYLHNVLSNHRDRDVTFQQWVGVARKFLKNEENFAQHSLAHESFVCFIYIFLVFKCYTDSIDF